MSLLELAYTRARYNELWTTVVLTPDGEVAKYCFDQDIPVYHSAPPMRSVAHELLQAARAYEADIVILVTGDSVGVTPQRIIDAVANLTNDEDFYGDLRVSGAEVRVVRVEALAEMVADIEAELEHGLTRFYNLRLQSGRISERTAAPKLSIDIPGELLHARAVLKEVGPWASTDELIQQWGRVTPTSSDSI